MFILHCVLPMGQLVLEERQGMEEVRACPLRACDLAGCTKIKRSFSVTFQILPPPSHPTSPVPRNPACILTLETQQHVC